MPRKTLRLTAPLTDSPTAHFYRTDEDGEMAADGVNWNGPIWAMLLEIAETYGLTLVCGHVTCVRACVHACVRACMRACMRA